MDNNKVLNLYQRTITAPYTGFPAICSELFRVIGSSVSPTNGSYKSLEDARETKWRDWMPTRIPKWKMPDQLDDCESLAWDLFRTFVERPGDKASFQLEMYHQTNISENHRYFIRDFGDFFGDAIRRIIQEELADEPSGREKQQKFGILDVSTLLHKDLERTPGFLGRAVIYLDLDDFKALNTKYTERVVDANILPILHQTLRNAAQYLGHAYAEGGDEFIVLLPNASKAIAEAFAEDLRKAISNLRFTTLAEVEVTASLGLAWQAVSDGRDLPLEANDAKRKAKLSGKNRVEITQRS